MRAALLCLGLLAALATPAAPPVRAQDDPFEAIAPLVRRRADAEALRALVRSPGPVRDGSRGRYLRGRLLERLGRWAEAAEAFPVDEAAAGLPDTVRADAARRRAIALARAGRCEAAAALLEDLGDDPLIQARAAECRLASGDEGAVEALRRVVARAAPAVDLFAARFELAEALARAGEREEARRVLLELSLDRVEHPEAPRAWAALEALTDGEVALTFDQRLRRAERLMEVRRYPEALTELEAAGRPPGRAELRRFLHARGMALYQTRRRYPEAAEVLAESAGLGGAHAADDAFHAARALSRADRDREAIRAYRRFARRYRSHQRAAEATYLAAWLELRHGLAGGERQMSRFVRGPLADRAPRLARDGRWQLALRAFERGRHRRAAELFQRYADSDAQPLVRGRGLYWVGRAHHARGDHRAAIAAYREALYVEPLHWYGMLARQRLMELGEDSPPPFPEPPEDGAEDAPPLALPEDAQLYAALGLREDARDALRSRERELRRADGLRAVVEAYQRLGEPSRLVRLAGGPSTTRRRAQPGPADRWRWDAAYPQPWRREVQSAARAAGLSPAHLYAVMRQESGYDPDAVSYADAIGLMQLIPPTAARLAEDMGLELEREMLFDPAVNVRLGAAYVGALVRRFGVPLAFAAFNAGEHRVAEWLEEQGRTELDLFVERIPFQQTRNYVRRVTTHFAHYLYLRDPAGGWPLTLPSHVPVPAD